MLTQDEKFHQKSARLFLSLPLHLNTHFQKCEIEVKEHTRVFYCLWNNLIVLKLFRNNVNPIVMIICTLVKSNLVSLIKNSLKTFEFFPSLMNLKTVTTLTNTHIAVQKHICVWCFLRTFDQIIIISAVVLTNEDYVVSKLFLSVCLS